MPSRRVQTQGEAPGRTSPGTHPSGDPICPYPRGARGHQGARFQSPPCPTRNRGAYSGTSHSNDHSQQASWGIWNPPTPPEAEWPTKELTPAEVSMEEVAPTEESKEEPATPTVTVSKLAMEPTIPPLQCKKGERGEVPRGNFPAWTEVLHSTWLVIPVGWNPPILSGLRQQHSSLSAVRKAWHWWAKELKQAVQKSDLTLLPGSSKPEPKIAPPPGFKGVAACLLRDLPFSTPVEAPWETRQPDTLEGPTVAMMYTTHIVQDETTGVTFIDMVTTSIGKVALGNPHMVANFWGSTIEDITDLSQGGKAGGCP